MRILITGSRTWTKKLRVYEAIDYAWDEFDGPDNHPSQLTIVHGDCPTGPDRFAKMFVEMHTGDLVIEEAHPADWSRYGKRGGFIRNSEMVNLGADLCLAFIHNNSKGATMTANLAEKAGIPVKRYILND